MKYKTGKFLTILMLVASLFHCKEETSGSDEQMEALTTFFALSALSSLSGSCTDNGPYHYFALSDALHINETRTKYLMGSSDGSCWTIVDGLNLNTAEYTQFIFSAAVSTGNISVVTIENSIYYTTDGVNYTAATLPAGYTTVNSLYFINNKFYTTAGTDYLVSTDGMTWTAIATPASYTLPYKGALGGYTSGGTEYLMSMYGGSCPVLNTSTDGGTSWYQPGTCSWSGGTYFSWVMSGNSSVIGFDSEGQMLKTTDGTSFTQTYPLTAFHDGTPTDIYPIGYFGGKFLVGIDDGYSDSTIVASTDAVTWTLHTTLPTSTNSDYIGTLSGKTTIEGANGTLVNHFAYSNDNGVTWLKSNYQNLELPDGSFSAIAPSGNIIYIP